MTIIEIVSRTYSLSFSLSLSLSLPPSLSKDTPIRTIRTISMK